MTTAIKEDARQFALANFPLVHETVRKCQKQYRVLSLDEMRSIAAVEIFHTAEIYDPAKAEFSTYLYWRCRKAFQMAAMGYVTHGIMTYRTVDRLKKDGKERPGVVPYIREYSPADEGFVDEICRREELAMVRRAVAGLEDARLREIITRHYFGEETLVAIGKTLELSRERIRQLKIIAEERIGRMLRNMGIES